MSPEPDPSSEASDERKVVVLFKATGDAPILRRNVVKIRASAKFEEILAHLTKSTRCERAFAYLGAAFAPRYDATIGALCDGYGERNDEGGKLVVFYSTTPAWG
ncbi:Ubiquitin-like protein Atg12 [Ostreococcus tauri]|jgi:ubiquitin-like protein ATG12|uniref:Ubiquitin-like protein ATG12 n=1 Tax=Ostreococcus tauri TaxID=70448 RepID=A0A090M1X5_OSTTA|nr:Ubiquitin-like protein Atg12 [Ostreococcus tauri]CEF98235.1 Ubiquitin-like protein Atg12 [Ostreococcus tauri]|eukprot:XP_022839153.1 Ubiquitin-like protein Atg12 [Ostreococcus tauri]